MVINFLGAVTANTPPPVNVAPFAGVEEIVVHRRQERRLCSAGEETIVVDLNWKFKPTPEMLTLRNELDLARIKTLAAFQKLQTKSSKLPNFPTLKELRSLIGDATYIERKYENAEQKAREEFEAGVKKDSEALFQHQERVFKPMLVNLKDLLEGTDLVDGLEKFRAKSRAESEAAKAKIRRERKLRRQEWKQRWLNQLTE